jgi:P27 family predicted phage terminase small subunit
MAKKRKAAKTATTRRGPIPRSNKQKRQTGNQTRRKTAGRPPAFKRGTMEPPEWLGELGRRKWVELLAELDEEGLIKAVDREALACYCEAVEELATAKKTLAEEGSTFTTEKGYVGQHPAVAIKNKAVARVRQFALEFGLTPAARARLRIEDGDEQSGEDKSAEGIIGF